MRSTVGLSADAQEQPAKTTGQAGVRRNRLGTGRPQAACGRGPVTRRHSVRDSVSSASYADDVRIATWNINSITTRLPRVVDWLQQTDTDVLCVQETKVADTAFPSLPFEEIGYEVAHYGQGRWNGVAVLSRVGIKDVERGFAAPAAVRRQAGRPRRAAGGA